MVILENIDIDKAILQNIDIDKISNRFKFGISNRAIPNRKCVICIDSVVIQGPLSFGIFSTSLCRFLHVYTTRTLPHICTDCAVHRTTIMTACSHTNGLVPWARHHRHAEARKNERCGYGGLSTLQYNLYTISLSLTHSTLSFKYKLFWVREVVFVL